MSFRHNLSPLQATAASLYHRSPPSPSRPVYPLFSSVILRYHRNYTSLSSFSSFGVSTSSSVVVPFSSSSPLLTIHSLNTFVASDKGVHKNNSSVHQYPSRTSTRSFSTTSVLSPTISAEEGISSSSSSSSSTFSSRFHKKYKDSPIGIVETITGDTVIVKGLSRATPHSLILFQNGALGLTIDIRKDSSLKIVLVTGNVLPRETAIVITNHETHYTKESIAATVTSSPPLFTTPLSLPVNEAILGRIIDPLGQPLDGQGSYVVSSAASAAASNPSDETDSSFSVTRNKQRLQSVFQSQVPSIIERERAYSTISTGIKAWDSFTPLLRGQTTVLYGEKGIGKTHTVLDIMEHIAKLNDIYYRLHNEESVTVPTVENPSTSSLLPLPSNFPIYMVYVAIGTPINILKDIVRKFQQILPMYNPDNPLNRYRNILRYVTIVAAPSNSHIGAQYLAPFTGTAIGEYFRNQGKHALVIYDDLSTHFTVSRRISGMDWNRTIATPTLHAQLFERHAQLKRSTNNNSFNGTNGEKEKEGLDREGGGSLTGIAIIDNLPPSTSTIQASPDTGKTREFITNLCSLADNVVELTTEGFRSGALFPINFATMGVHPAHIAQGSVLRYYINRMRETLVDLREIARGASAAASLGVESENDQADVLLDMHAKTRALLNPTHNLLRAVVETASTATATSLSPSSSAPSSGPSTIGSSLPSSAPLSPEQITKLGIEGLTFPVVGPGQRHSNNSDDNSNTSTDDNSNTDGGGINPKLKTIVSLTGTDRSSSTLVIKGILSSSSSSTSSSIITKSTNGRTDGSSSKVSTTVGSNPKARSFSTVPFDKNNNNNIKEEDNISTSNTTVSSSESNNNNSKYSSLINRMDPSQLKTYYAVAQRRQKKTVSAQMAAAASGGGSINLPPKQSAAEAYFSSGQIPEEMIKVQNTTKIKETKLSTVQSPDSTDSNRPSSPSTTIHSSFSRRPTGFTGIYGNRINSTTTTNKNTNDTSSNISATSTTNSRSYSVWLPCRRYMSSLTTNTPSEDPEKDHKNHNNSPTMVSSEGIMEKSFRLPTHRRLPMQTFADVCPPISRVSDEPLPSISSSSSNVSLPIYSTVLSDQAGITPRLAPLWDEAPYKGDTGRLLCTLFILVHGYVQYVPLHRIYEYEAGVYNLLASLPVSSSKVVAFPTQHLPLASYTLGYPTLLDAAMNTIIASSAISKPYIDIGTRLREATQTFIRQSSELTTTEEKLRIEQKEKIWRQEQELKKSSKLSKSSGSSWFSTFFGGSTRNNPPVVSKDSEETLSSTESRKSNVNDNISIPASPVNTEVSTLSSFTVSDLLSSYDRSLLGYVRLDISVIERTVSMEEVYSLVEYELQQMEPIWAIMHIVVAEYTRKFTEPPSTNK